MFSSIAIPKNKVVSVTKRGELCMNKGLKLYLGRNALNQGINKTTYFIS